MKHSIASKIFVVVAGALLVILLLQWTLLSGAFNQLYYRSILSTMQRELSEAVQQYRAGGENRADRALNEYSLKTGSSVMVIDENYEFGDLDFLSRLTVMSVALKQGDVVNIPIDYLSGLSPRALQSLSVGGSVDVKLVQVGNTAYYEPLTLVIGEAPYTNGPSMREYTVVNPDVEKINASGTVLYRDLPQTSGTQAHRAGLVYDAVKDCLIAKTDIETYLEHMVSAPVYADGAEYRFLYETRVIDGMKYYFVTVQNVVVTGFEKAYLNQYFLAIYIFIGILLLCTAYFIAHRISKPIRHISRVTEKIANLDFSEHVASKGQDELAHLAANINCMSASLESALSELKSSNQELEKASTLSKENEERMKRLLADLAHEFKTPLGVIAGFSDVLISGINEEPPEHYLEIMKSEVAGLIELVNETIELTKLQSGYWSIHIEEHSFAQILTTVVRKFEKRLQSSGFQLKTEIEDAIVAADEHRIGQVLTNFLTNAVKYGDNNIIEITSRVDGRRLVVSIGNSGYISDEDLEKIWNRAYSTEQLSRARLPSQGIGLDIVKKILHAHGSEYGVRRENGMVYFQFTLPICE